MNRVITTYLIENLNDRSVFNYYQTLRSAKEDLALMGTDWRILVVKGHRYEEGYHAYQVTYFGRVFLKQEPDATPAYKLLRKG
jgi:hypothetical protein